MATTNKYDRQLRLWGPQGQKRLSESKILLLNANPSSTETLKNLVLPGCGYFCIVDSQNVSERDLGNNFFCSYEFLNKPRSESITKNLLEMNPDDVKGEFLQADPLQKALDEQFISKFDLVITSNIPHNTLSQLSHICAQKNVKIIALQTNGFIASIQIQGQQHTIIESKPERTFFDYSLRLQEPFQELQQYVDQFDIQYLSQAKEKTELSHVPFIVLLIKHLQKYKNENGGFPKSFQQKSQFKQQIDSEMKALLEPKDRENYEEAIANSHWAYKNNREIPDNLQNVFELMEKHQQDTSDFWILVKALHIFLKENDNFLPVQKAIPDMKATTDWYVQLKEIYVKKHNQDKAKFEQILRTHFPQNQLSQESISIFLENVYSLEVINYSSIFEQIQKPKQIDDQENKNHLWFICLQASFIFLQENGRFPGVDDQEKLNDIIQRIKNEIYQIKDDIGNEFAQEICRYEGAQLHNISAVLGGIASQEAVKLITEQFLSLNNTFVFNGITCEGVTLEF